MEITGNMVYLDNLGKRVKITNKDNENALLTLAEEVFVPTTEMRKIKQKFWYSWKQGPSKGDITIAQVINITGCRSVETWAKRPGFKEWLINDQEHGQRLEYLFDIGLDALESLILTGERAGDKLKAIEQVAKLSQKIGKPEAQIRFMDQDIQEMNEKQIDAYLKKLGVIGGDDEEKDL